MRLYCEEPINLDNQVSLLCAGLELIQQLGQKIVRFPSLIKAYIVPSSTISVDESAESKTCNLEIKSIFYALPLSIGYIYTTNY
jgi:hypothetical protein